MQTTRMMSVLIVARADGSDGAMVSQPKDCCCDHGHMRWTALATPRVTSAAAYDICLCTLVASTHPRACCCWWHSIDFELFNERLGALRGDDSRDGAWYDSLRVKTTADHFACGTSAQVRMGGEGGHRWAPETEGSLPKPPC